MSTERPNTMFNQTYSREDFADALSAFARHFPGNLSDRINASRIVDQAATPYRRTESLWDTLNRLEPEGRALFLSMVQKHLDPTHATDIASDYARIQDPKGVTIQVQNSGDDPFTVDFHIQDEGVARFADLDTCDETAPAEAPSEAPADATGDAPSGESLAASA